MLVCFSVVGLLPLAFAKRAVLGQDIAHLLDLLPFAVEIIGNGAFQAGMGDEMRRMGGAREDSRAPACVRPAPPASTRFKPLSIAKSIA